MTITVSRVKAELRTDSDNVATASPRLSWLVTGPAAWRPTWSEIRRGDGEVRHLGPGSVFVDWPFAPLVAHERQTVQVRVGDEAASSDWSEPLRISAAFLDDGEWDAPMIGLAGADAAARPALVRVEFDARDDLVAATLYATAHGVYQVQLNGDDVDDAILKPGWTAYQHRLVHETTDVTSLVVPGRNAVGASLAGGWYTEEFLGRKPAFYGTTPAVAIQLRLDYADGQTRYIRSGSHWTAAPSPITASGIYAGEDYDARLEQPGWSTPGFDDSTWTPARVDTAPFPVPTPQIAQPVRAVEERPVEQTVSSASGAQILDFGQNLVGRLRIAVQGEAGTVVTLRHAEVLEHGELGIRPLRGARASDSYTLRGNGVEVWEPSFTFHGFRYAQISGIEIQPEDVTAVVLGSDLSRTGWFQSSDSLLNRFHENVVWGMRGNFLSIPTDCPQRDERLGWTGDIQVFAPTASYLFDTDAFLTSWLTDLSLEQREAGGIVPFVIPDPTPDGKRPTAAWGDAATVVPSVLFERLGDLSVLHTQLPSMRAWADVLLARAGAARLWRGDFQFGDWLDPASPPDNPFDARTDADLVATAYLFRSVELVAKAAATVGDMDLAEEYRAHADEVRVAFVREFVTAAGRISSDAPTAYTVAITFGLFVDEFQRDRMGARLAELVRANGYRIATGFVGTPLIGDALTITGHLAAAERLLLQTENPSWLYSVKMGATTVWERWDSMLEDGTINPGEMTSFNHYALGAIADWMHRTVAGLAPAAPGYQVVQIAPRPLRHLTSAEAAFDSAYGRIRVAWHREGDDVVVEAAVPTGVQAIVDLPGSPPAIVESGEHRWSFRDTPIPNIVTDLDYLTTPLSVIIDDEEAYETVRGTLRDIDSTLAERFNRQILWTDAFTLDEVLRALTPTGQRRVKQALVELNARHALDRTTS